MRDVTVTRREVIEERRTYASNPPDGAVILDGAVRLIDGDTGEVVAVQALPEMPWASDVARSLRGIKWAGAKANHGDEVRLSGFKNAHRTFGHSAPVPLRRRYGCSVCQFNAEYPRLTRRMEQFADLASAVFATAAPEQAEAHVEAVSGIDRSWLFGSSVWTSGIINRTSALPYHRDSGNVKGSWSAMLGLRRGVSGGLLHLAEWGVYLTIPDRSITLFDGQAVLHAVTPFAQEHTGAFRYTAVVYAKAAMTKCLVGDDEIKRAQRLRSEAEEREAAKIAAKRQAAAS